MAPDAIGTVRTVGVDLASRPERTDVCEIVWSETEAVAGFPVGRATDEALLDVIDGADKVGIDCPLGWPDPFVDAVVAHRAGQPWPGRERSGDAAAAYSRSLQLRATDAVVGKAGRAPLSVSTDRIGIVALRAAGLLDALAVAGRPVNRDGSGVVAEVYPAAALRAWGLTAWKYKKSANRPVLARLVDDLCAALPALRFAPGAQQRCRDSDDAFDALICALVARAVERGLTARPQDADEQARAATEGWIHLPTPTALATLLASRQN